MILFQFIHISFITHIRHVFHEFVHFVFSSSLSSIFFLFFVFVRLKTRFFCFFWNWKKKENHDGAQALHGSIIRDFGKWNDTKYYKCRKKSKMFILLCISIVFIIHSHIKINTDRYSGDVRNRRRGRDFCERNDRDNHFRNVWWGRFHLLSLHNIN